MSSAYDLDRLRGRFQILLLVALLVVSTLWAHFGVAGSEPQQTAIRVTTNLVVLPVNVTDSKGEFVAGLLKENFRVYEDGKLQNLTLFVQEDTPVTVGLLVDHSRSMAAKLADVTTAVSVFAHSSNPADEMFVVDFSEQVSIEEFEGTPFTSNPAFLEKAVMAVSARGQTALYDAVSKGLNHLELGSREKKALVIVSDGGDNASRHKYSEVLQVARGAQAVIYAIVLAGNAEEEENPRALERLCKDTGGIAFFPRSGLSIYDAANAIARDLREQYTLGYSPNKKVKDNSFRRVAVHVDAPGRSGLRVRTRAGYLVPDATSSQTEGDNP